MLFIFSSYFATRWDKFAQNSYRIWIICIYTLTEHYEKKLQNSIHYSIKKYLEINQEGERYAQWKLQNTVEDKWKHCMFMDSKT